MRGAKKMSKYKVGDKVILTVTGLNDKVYYPYYMFNDAKSNLWQSNVDKYAEPLSTYTEPLEAKINRQATEIKRLIEENEKLKKDLEYYHTGTDICDMESARITGQNEAWELAKKFVLYGKGCYSDEEVKKIFGFACGPTVLRNYTYSEAVTKVEEWENAKEEIKSGDVLEDIYDSNVKCIFTNLYPNNMAYLVFYDGTAGMHKLDYFKKTGRHIDIDSFKKTGRHTDIDSFLKQIKGE